MHTSPTAAAGRHDGAATTADVVVLGAGPAGLGAAYRLATSGRRVTVVERSDRVGGVAGSFTLAGLRVDHGSHRLHPATDPSILATLRGLLGDDLQRRRRNGRIRLLGRWIAFPLRATDVVRHLPAEVAWGAARDALTASRRHAGADTFAEVLRAQLGPTICEHFYFPYARKLWGVEPEQLAGEQARRRVSAGTPGALLRRLLPRRGPDAGTFWYPRRGFGQLWEALADAAVEAGAVVATGATVERVELDADGVTVTTSAGTVAAGATWSTLPLTALVRMLSPAAPQAVHAAADRLRLRAMVLAYLVVDADRYTPYDAHYLPETWTPVTRISEPKNYRDSSDDPVGTTVLCAEIPCDRGDPVWEADAATLRDVVVDALTGCGLPPPRVIEVHVRRLPAAYPIYDLGYAEAFATVDGWLREQDRLLTFGRQGLFAHDNSHHALAMAWAAADALADDGAVDRTAWELARRSFEAHVVED